MAKLQILKHIKRGPYVQFSTTGKFWDDGSIFLDEAVFGVLSESFSKSHENFNYYGPTEFRVPELIKLRAELAKFDSQLSEITDFESFQREISSIPMARNLFQSLKSENNVDVKLQWEHVAKALKEINLALLQLAEQCARESKVVWVFGI
jgi:hypothetical protein